MAKPTILFFTNKELGQATVVLAVAHELLIRKSYTVHIASFPQLETAVSQLNTQAATLAQSASTTVTFHALPGRSMVDAVLGNHPYDNWFSTHDIGFFGACRAYKKLCGFVAPWTGDEYIAVYRRCIEIIKQVQPSIVVVEPLLAQAIDACRTLSCKYVLLSPNTAKDHVIQPMLGNLAVSVGLTLAKSPALKAINDRRHAEGIDGPYPIMASNEKSPAPVLLASRAEIDFPCFVPDHVTRCGPILRPFGVIGEECPGLAGWLSQRPTVLVNLGSIVCFSKEQARNFADGLRTLLDARPDVQVYWKLKSDRAKETADSIPAAIKSILDEVISGRVRIEEWLPVEPICILQSGHVCCMVHHGGANSYNEAVRAGVPQIVLPVWFDTYDFATRVEYLGVGVWASKTSAPAINGLELGKAFIRVLDSEESLTIREKAKTIASKLGASEGRVVACEKLIGLMQG